MNSTYLPDWQCIEADYASLLGVRQKFDEAMASAIESRNAGAHPALFVLIQELEGLTRSLLSRFVDDPSMP